MKTVLVCAVGLFCSVVASGQRTFEENGKPSFFDRVYFGGGMSFSSGVSGTAGRYTYIGLYPIVGYMVTNQFSVGSAITYQHYSYPDVGQTIDQYGISPFMRYNFGQVFVYSEYMILNSASYDPNSPRKIYNRWLNGIGYQQPLGKRGAINAMALYDVLYSQSNTIFPSPWVFRVFFSF